MCISCSILCKTPRIRYCSSYSVRSSYRGLVKLQRQFKYSPKNYQKTQIQCNIAVSPTSSNTNFGYIKANQQINKYLYLGTQFIEKPNKELAKKLTALPEYFWNSGIYIFNIDYILKLTNQLIPVISRKLSTIFNSNLYTKSIVKLNKQEFRT